MYTQAPSPASHTPNFLACSVLQAKKEKGRRGGGGRRGGEEGEERRRRGEGGGEERGRRGGGEGEGVKRARKQSVLKQATLTYPVYLWQGMAA